MKKPPMNKSTIKNDPFEALIPSQPINKSEPKAVHSTPTPKRNARATPVANLDRTVPDNLEQHRPVIPNGRQKLTVHLEADVVNRVKNAAFWNPRLTIANIAERGIRVALREVEKEYGGVYPQRETELVGGRPIK